MSLDDPPAGQNVPAVVQLLHLVRPVCSWYFPAAQLLHAAALRTTFAREEPYKLVSAAYARPIEIFGRMSFLALCGDHLQLPPVPKSVRVMPLIWSSAVLQTFDQGMYVEAHCAREFWSSSTMLVWKSASVERSSVLFLLAGEFSTAAQEHVIPSTAKARSLFVTEQDIEDYTAEAFLQIVNNDLSVLRRFKGISSLATY